MIICMEYFEHIAKRRFVAVMVITVIENCSRAWIKRLKEVSQTD